MSKLPELDGDIVIYGHGPEVEELMHELRSRELPTLLMEEDEAVARKLLERGERVVHATLAEDGLDLRTLVGARALVVNGEDEANAMLALGAREQGFAGPIVAMISNPNRRAPMLLAGANAAFTPNHVLAAAIAVRASVRIAPRVAGMHALREFLEIAEIRIHGASSLAGKTLAESAIQARTGVNIVAQWVDDALASPPSADSLLEPGMMLLAAGSPDSIRKLSDVARPITDKGTLVVLGCGNLGRKLVEIFTDAGEEFCVVDGAEGAGIDVVGDVLDPRTLERAAVATARAVVITLGSDNAALLATTVVRDLAPDVPIIASADLAENVSRIHRAGADFVLSITQVAGQLLTHHILHQSASHRSRIRIARFGPGRLTGDNPLASQIREGTGCSVVAVERAGQVLTDIPPSFALEADDSMFVCGTPDAFTRYDEQFPDSR